jgi:hypothetical protein
MCVRGDDVLTVIQLSPGYKTADPPPPLISEQEGSESLSSYL